MNQPLKWQVLQRFVEIKSPWLTLIGEKLQDNHDQILDYWRVEKANSVVIITLQSGQFILPMPMYRPGLDEFTLDFPGGRINDNQTPELVIHKILQKELGIIEQAIIDLTALNKKGWAINSSFSNQKLYGFVAEIDPNFTIPRDLIGSSYINNQIGVEKLLQDLTCLQCRAILLEYERKYSSK